LPSDYDDFDPFHSTSWDKIEYQVDTSPRLYLDFAIKDLEFEKSGRTLVNSLSNAKRALHLQVETLANAFGFSVINTKKWPNFHDYLAYCEKCGIVTPRILKKLNKVRNAVEHEYYIPTESETEDFVDVVELFLAATDRFIYQFPLEFEFLPRKKLNSNAPDIAHVEIKPYIGELFLIIYPQEDRDEDKEDWDVYRHKASIKLSPKDESFFIWLALLVEKVHKS
jgi:hypothetical protein